MKNTNSLWILFICLFLLGYLGSCKFNPEGIPAKEYFYTCDMDVMKCPPVNLPLKVTLEKNPNFLQIGNYKLQYDLWKDKSSLYQAYWDKPIYVYNTGYDKLKGSVLVMTGFDDWNVNNPALFRLHVNNNVESIYVAYDSRISPPGWLTREYSPVKDSAGKAHSLEITMTDQTKPSPTPQNIKLNVWERKTPTTSGQWVTLPGNSFQSQAGGGVPPNNRANYIVLVKPDEKGDCSKGATVKKDRYEGCVTVDRLGNPDWRDVNKYAPVKTAKKECESKNPGKQCVNIRCTYQCMCKDRYTLKGGSGLLTVVPNYYQQSSQIEFLPSISVADFTVKGRNVKRKVTGELQFEYLYKTNKMIINGMNLFTDPIEAGGGTFTDITFVLVKPSSAECQGTPTWGYPCDRYKVPKESYFTILGSKYKGKDLLFFGANKSPLDVRIDHPTRSFKVSGDLQTTVTIDDEPTPLDIKINLTGRFKNFAPEAVGKESTRFAQCAEKKNRDKIILDAAGSYDIYDSIPSSAYEWYEDYMLVTQKLWGKGKKVTINPYELVLGVHDMTLVVRDSQGVADTDTLQVIVGDIKPPTISAPHDVYFLITPPDSAPIKLDIGKAGALDTCLGNPFVTNDAPKDLLFPVGTTTVTWVASDGGGNTAKDTQNIIVATSKGKMPEGSKIEPSPAVRCDQYANTAISQYMKNMESACGFKGPAWSENYTNHYDWCMRVPRTQSDAGTKQREEDLANMCGAAQPSQPQGGGTMSGPEVRCDQYAKTAISQNQENISKGCGFGGSRWNSDYNHHYKWCVNVPKQFADFETSERNKEITNSCSGTRSPGLKNEGVPVGPDARCDQYAKTAISQNQQNMESACGFTGPAWSPDYNHHYDWCVRVQKEQADAGTKMRSDDLRNKCVRIEQ